MSFKVLIHRFIQVSGRVVQWLRSRVASGRVRRLQPSVYHPKYHVHFCQLMRDKPDRLATVLLWRNRVILSRRHPARHFSFRCRWYE